MSFKRHRSQSEASSSSSTSVTAHPTSKAQRTTDASTSTVHPLLCTLPPTCNHQPTPIANPKDLETHYATYHAHVCEEPNCDCVFPDARLLEIHQTECHDPLAAVRKDRGEKIFACHLASCNKLFATPKARRLHLIQGHGYPKEYYFAVTNKGVGGLLRRWGEGASLMRGEWTPRDGAPPKPKSDPHSVLIEEDDEDEDEEPASSLHHPHSSAPGEGVDALADSLNALSLVPPSIRFGRGGKNGGFAPNERGGGRAQPQFRGRGRGQGPYHPHPLPQQQQQPLNGNGNDADAMDIDAPRSPRANFNPGRGRGRGFANPNPNASTNANGGRNEPDVLQYVPRRVRARGKPSPGGPRGG
ncbi:hypothetical protein C8F04DRAFT_1097768 [Mycena alexandri]|uniref:C2H2-type domain-containing protein n=1 Tax=Mycena alexandri TaxID=1745969 RepID=A0AAD6X831_9AGAR|nr:hypothetical protein C8F04DRAFT_1097768 [Mycena alexandri]